MALPDLDSSVGHSFGLEFDGITIKAITEVSGLKMEQDVIELKQNSPTASTSSRSCPAGRRPARSRSPAASPPTTASRSGSKDSQFGKMGDARKGGAIIVFDYEGNAIKRYKLTNAWPKSLEIGSLKAGDTSVLTEKLVITYERLEVE